MSPVRTKQSISVQECESSVILLAYKFITSALVSRLLPQLEWCWCVCLILTLQALSINVIVAGRLSTLYTSKRSVRIMQQLICQLSVVKNKAKILLLQELQRWSNVTKLLCWRCKHPHSISPHNHCVTAVTINNGGSYINPVSGKCLLSCLTYS